MRDTCLNCKIIYILTAKIYTMTLDYKRVVLTYGKRNIKVPG